MLCSPSYVSTSSYDSKSRRRLACCRWQTSWNHHKDLSRSTTRRQGSRECCRVGATGTCCLLPWFLLDSSLRTILFFWFPPPVYWLHTDVVSVQTCRCQTNPGAAQSCSSRPARLISTGSLLTWLPLIQAYSPRRLGLSDAARALG